MTILVVLALIAGGSVVIVRFVGENADLRDRISSLEEAAEGRETRVEELTTDVEDLEQQLETCQSAAETGDRFRSTMLEVFRSDNRTEAIREAVRLIGLSREFKVLVRQCVAAPGADDAT